MLESNREINRLIKMVIIIIHANNVSEFEKNSS